MFESMFLTPHVHANAESSDESDYIAPERQSRQAEDESSSESDYCAANIANDATDDISSSESDYIAAENSSSVESDYEQPVTIIFFIHDQI